jgi:hypothetical protein
MSRVYRVSKSPEVGEVVDSVQSAEAFARENGPGRYHVDEHAADYLPGSKSSARAWGNVIHQPGGHVVLEPHPWTEL